MIREGRPEHPGLRDRLVGHTDIRERPKNFFRLGEKQLVECLGHLLKHHIQYIVDKRSRPGDRDVVLRCRGFR